MRQLQDALTTALGTHQARAWLDLMRRIACLLLSHASALWHCSGASSWAHGGLSGQSQQLDPDSVMQIL